MRATARLLVLAVLLVPAVASAKQHRYAGKHPVHAEGGGGFCHVEVPHVHVYGPERPDVQYRSEGGWNHFVGDPVAYGYDGPRFVFHGAHPVYSGVHVHYCYLKGQHFHDYQPEEERPGFVMKGGVYFYVGEFPKTFYVDKPRYAKINAVYQPIRYERPAVVVEPPPNYHDIYVTAPSGRATVVTPGVHAEASVGVDVVLPPPPSLEVRFGVGVGVPVVVEDHHHHDVIIVDKHKHRHFKHKKHKRHRGRW